MPAFFVIDQLSSDDRFDLSADHTCSASLAFVSVTESASKSRISLPESGDFAAVRSSVLNIGDQFRKFDPGIECRIIIIFYISEIPVHDLAKNKIDIKEHFLSASEILCSLISDFRSLPSYRYRIFHEQLRAEARRNR